MLLSLGPLRLRLHGSSRWLDLARQRYDTFVVQSAPPGPDEIRVDYEAGPEGPSAEELDECMLRPLDMRLRSGVWHLSAAGVTGSMDERRIRLQGPLATFPLDSAMIALWSLVCGPNAAIVHGALLANEDRGWLCTGPSGVGKSTLAGLLPRRALCDELTGVRIESGELVAYGLPFWRGRPGRRQLEGVHFLEHGLEHELRRLSPDEAFGRIHSQILWPSWSETALEGAFRVAASLAGLPCGVLSFRPEPSVWRQLAVRLNGLPLVGTLSQVEAKAS